MSGDHNLANDLWLDTPFFAKEQNHIFKGNNSPEEQ